MKTQMLLALVLFVFCTSCKKEVTPFTDFKDLNYKILSYTETDVNLDAEYWTIVESRYKGSKPGYKLQINEQEPVELENLSYVTTDKESYGWDGKDGLDFEIIRVKIDVTSNDFNAGDRIKFFIQHSNDGQEHQLILFVK